MNIDPKKLARELIESAAGDIDFVSIGDRMESIEGADALPPDEWDKAQSEIDHLIEKAIVLVTLPGDLVCATCGNLGAGAQDDGTPKDFAAWESFRDEALRAAEAALQRLREEGESDMRSAIHAVRTAIEDIEPGRAESEPS